jgi:hypothetical protein
MKTVIGIFEDREDLEDAIDVLREEGYDPKDVSIIMKDTGEENIVEDNTGLRVTNGALSGVATGTILGGIAGLVASAVLPGLGAFFIGGPIAASLGLAGAAATTLSGAATGAVAGGLLGALVGLGLTEEEARVYEDRVNEGAILVAVPARADEEDQVEDILYDNNATDIKVVSGRRDEDEEILRAGKRYHEGPRPMFAGVKGGRTSKRR